MSEIEEYNLKWLEYMNNADLEKISLCPNGHLLIKYPNFKFKGELVITCPQGDCDYYDYHTFRVSDDKKISHRIRRLRR